MAGSDHGPRAPGVLVLVAAVVGGVLLVIGLASLVPALGDLLAGWPAVVVVLVVGTLLVLARSLRR